MVKYHTFLISSLALISLIYILVKLDLSLKSTYSQLNMIRKQLEILKSYIKLSNKDLSNEIFSIYELWTELFKHSEQQAKINPEVLTQTLKFMIDEVDENDPNLVKFVSTLIHRPSTENLNLTIKNKSDFSQIGQSKYIDSLLHSVRNGFFIEAGGYDGETFSNTLFFEIERNWTGLLIEPVPNLFNLLLSKNRNVYSINACIAKSKPIISKFKVSDALSGRDAQMTENHNKRIGDQFEVIYVPCFSLSTILKALQINKIDYFSLDLEGGEWDVINSLDLNKLNIRSFSIEYPADLERKRSIIKYLKENDYKMTKEDGQDFYFIKK